MIFKEFEASIEKFDSVCRRLEIIGEATKRLSSSLKSPFANTLEDDGWNA